MDVRTVIFIKEVLQVVFFVALLGCTTTVLLSWVKLLRDAFSKDDEEDEAPNEQAKNRRTGTL